MKRLALTALLLAPCALLLPSCAATAPDVSKPRANWNPIAVTVGWGAFAFTVSLPGRQDTPPLPQNPAVGKTPVLFSPGSF